MLMGAMQGAGQAFMFSVMAGTSHAVARGKQTIQVHLRRLRSPVFYPGIITGYNFTLLIHT